MKTVAQFSAHDYKQPIAWAIYYGDDDQLVTIVTTEKEMLHYQGQNYTIFALYKHPCA